MGARYGSHGDVIKEGHTVEVNVLGSVRTQGSGGPVPVGDSSALTTSPRGQLAYTVLESHATLFSIISLSSAYCGKLDLLTWERNRWPIFRDPTRARAVPILLGSAITKEC